MRILHTADWHLGRVLKGMERTGEIAGALDALIELVRSEHIDLVLVAGDLFDRAVVSAEAEATAFSFFLGLRECGVPALVISGNHDSRERLAALAPLLALTGAEVAARLSLREEGGVRRYPWGEAALMPFLSERRLVRAAGLLEGDASQWKGHYAEGMRRIIDNLTAGFSDRLGLLMAHLTAEGANLRLGGGEFSFYVSNSYAVPVSYLPTTAAYVALGHIHRQQLVSEAPAAWYPGSLVQLDFGEGEEAPRGALLVELELGLPARVHPVEARWGRSLRTFRIPLTELDQRLAEVERFSGLKKLVIQGQGNPALRERIYQEVDGVLEVRFETAPQEVMGDPLPEPQPAEALDWVETYRDYARDTRGIELGEAQEEAFRQVYEEVHATT